MWIHFFLHFFIHYSSCFEFKWNSAIPVVVVSWFPEVRCGVADLGWLRIVVRCLLYGAWLGRVLEWQFVARIVVLSGNRRVADAVPTLRHFRHVYTKQLAIEVWSDAVGVVEVFESVQIVVVERMREFRLILFLRWPVWRPLPGYFELAQMVRTKMDAVLLYAMDDEHEGMGHLERRQLQGAHYDIAMVAELALARRWELKISAEAANLCPSNSRQG